MNRYQALRAGPAYNRLAQAEDIASRFRPKKIAARPTLLDEERLEGGRIVHVRIEDLGDDRVRASVSVCHRWRKGEVELPQSLPFPLQRRCAALARELLEVYADTATAWERGGIWSAEGTRRQLELLR